MIQQKSLSFNEFVATHADPLILSFATCDRKWFDLKTFFNFKFYEV
jgi:hypothetical protein